MSTVDDKGFEKVVCRLNCGIDKATAFLISNNRAITATHAINKYFTNNAEIKLEFMNLAPEPIEIKAVPLQYSISSPITILDLEESVDNEIYCTFCNQEVNKDDDYEIFGYPVAKWGVGHRVTSKVIRRITEKMAQPYDWDIDLNNESNIEDFSGLSGSPLFVNNRLVGVVLTQNDSTGKAISLGAISIPKIGDLLNEAKVKIEQVIMYDKYELYELDDNIDYSNSTFIAMLESAEIFSHEECQQEFFNAEIAKSAIESKVIDSEIKKFKSMQSTVRSVWNTAHISYEDEYDGRKLLSQVYGRIEDLSETVLKGDGNLSLFVKKGMLHQLSDEEKLGWVRNYKKRVAEYLHERGQR